MPIVSDNQTPSDITKYATPFYLLQWALQFNEAGTCYEITLGNVTETLVFSNESITFNTCTLWWTWWLKNRNPNKDTHFNNEIHICIFYNKMDIVNEHWMNPKQIMKLNNYFFPKCTYYEIAFIKALGPHNSKILHSAGSLPHKEDNHSREFHCCRCPHFTVGERRHSDHLGCMYKPHGPA